MNKKFLVFSATITAIVFCTAANNLAQGRVGNRQRPTTTTATRPSTATGSTTRTKPQQTATRSTTGTKPELTATQQQNIQKLEDDLLAIKAGSQVTEAQKQDLANSLYALADGATRPDKSTVEKLATDLSAALTDGSLSNQEKAQISADLQAVMNSANISPQEVDAAVTSITTILEASNVSQSDVATIKTDLQNIATERKANRGSRLSGNKN